MWSFVEVIGVLVVLVALGYIVTTQPMLPSACDPASPLDADPETLDAHVRHLTRFPDRSFGNPAALEKVALHIWTTFESTCDDVRLEGFDVEGDTYHNVIARHGPSGSPIVVVGAHYDAIEGSPGADDNASGVAALFELSRRFDLAPPESAVELVAFALEEPPAFSTRHMGSMARAKALVEAGVSVRAMICLESIGYFSDRPGSQAFPLPLLRFFYPTRGDFIAVVGRYREIGLVRKVKRGMRRVTDLPVYSFNGPAFIPGISWSDHLAYWEHGFPAVMITDTALFRNPRYHSPFDLPEHLDFKRLAKTIVGIEGAVRELTRKS